MPDVQAFRAVRYDLGHVGSLADVVAPPYDVIGPELHEQLYKRHPANIVRIDFNREEPGDDATNNKYSRSAQFFKNWRREGVLFTEAQPAIYVYHQTYSAEGQRFTRRGFMARCRLERFGEGKIYPHEETLAGPKQDRLLLMRATKANLSQIFGLFPDPNYDAQDILERAIADMTPLEATDHLGVVNRIWPVTDAHVATAVSAALGGKPLFIADGHHRYETACNYRDELIAAGGPLSPEHPANFVLMMFVGMSDPGLLVLPTHRLLRGLPPMSSDELIKKLGDSFTTRLIGEGSDLAPTVWDEIATADEQGTIGLFTNKDERWVLALITSTGRQKMSQIASEHSAAWQGLGVAILHRLILETLLDGKKLPRPEYVHLVDEVVTGLDAGEFPLAALVTPATVKHIRTISEHGERMPAKSTYFYPKLLAGLVINPLE